MKLAPSISISGSDQAGMLAVRFDYKYERLREELKLLAGVHWNPIGKHWLVAEEYLPEVKELAEKHGLKTLDKVGEKKRYVPGTFQKLWREVNGIQCDSRLHDYQRKAVGAALSARTYMLNFEMGLGKTPTAIEVLKQAYAKRTLIVCPAMVRATWVDELQKWWPEVKATVIATGKDWNFSSEQIVITSYGLLEEATREPWDSIVFDECFPSRTKVWGAGGPISIEALRVGDRIWSFDPDTEKLSLQTVTHTAHKETTELLDIMLSGQCIKVTLNHPFLTADGWRRAEELSVGTSVVHVLPNESSKEALEAFLHAAMRESRVSPEKGEEDFCGTAPGAQDEPSLGTVDSQTNAQRESYAQRDNAGQGIFHAQSDAASSANAGWKWPEDAESAEDFSTRTGVAYRSGHIIGQEKKGIADLLQGGHSELGYARSGGSRRFLSCSAKAQSTGSKEGTYPGAIRMARVESIKHRRLDSNDRDRVVYNLQVSGPSTYLVGAGAVVHNCHYIKERKSARSKVALTLRQHNPKALVLLLTATPITSEPQDLWHQLEVMYPGRFGTYWQFVKRYCNTSEGDYGGIDIWGVNDAYNDELKKRLENVSIRVTKHEVAHLLPPFTTIGTKVEIGSKRLRELTEEFSEALEHKSQLNNFVSQAGHEKIPFAVERAVDVLQGGQSHVMVLTWFRETAHAIVEMLRQQKKLDVEVTHIDGDLNVTERGAVLAAAKEAKSSIVVATMASIREGIDLTKFTYVIGAELYWQHAMMEQVMGRYHRLSSNIPCTFEYLIIKGTLDEVIAKVLLRRSRDIGKVFKKGIAGEKMSEALGIKEQTDEEALLELREAAEKRDSFDEYT